MSTYTTWADYFDPDHPGVLKNRLGIIDADALRTADTFFSITRMVDVILDDTAPEAIDFDHYCRLHNRILQDVYPWAGTPRTVPDGPLHTHWRDVLTFDVDDPAATGMLYPHTPGPMVRHLTESVFDALASELATLEEHDRYGFTRTLALTWGVLDQIHPFPEGNARTQTILLHQLCRQHGYQLDGAQLLDHRDQFRAATLRGHAHREYGPLADLFSDAMTARGGSGLSRADRQWALSLGQQSQRHWKRTLERASFDHRPGAGRDR